MVAIALRNICKSWGGAPALEHIHLSIEPGSFCVLLGPSGCGKSTTLRIIAGLEAPDAGEVWIDGRNVTALAPAQRGLAMVFQNYALFPHLTVAENITFGLSVRRTPAAEMALRLKEAADLLGLQGLLQRKPNQLSGGQQQRVALGRALVSRAKICLMDEPLSNLDAQLRQDMRRELRELQQRLGLTVVYVTHDQSEAMSMADRVVLLHRGRIVQADSPRALYARPASVFAAGFIGTPPMNLLAVQDGCIAGSTVPAPPAATTLGVRPEAIELHPDGHAATVHSVEFLGADLVLRCRLGSQSLLARLSGRHPAAAGDTVHVRWAAQDGHGFDAQGLRLDAACGQPAAATLSPQPLETPP